MRLRFYHWAPGGARMIARIAIPSSPLQQPQAHFAGTIMDCAIELSEISPARFLVAGERIEMLQF